MGTITVNAYKLNRGDSVVATQGELDTALAAASSGNTIWLSTSWTDITATVSTGDYAGITLKGQSGHAIKTLTLSGVTNLTVDGLNFSYDNSAGANNDDSISFAYLVLAGTTHSIEVRNCTFDGYPTASDGSQQTEAEMDKRWTGIRTGTGTFTGGTGLTVSNCTFVRMYDGLSPNNVPLTVDGCSFSQIYIDAITGLVNGLADTGKGWVINNNDFTLFEGINKRRYTVSGVTGGDPVADETYISGNKVIKVVSYDSGNFYVYGAYNNFETPNTTETYTLSGGGKSFTVDAIASAATYDGKHGDVCQPIKNSGSGNVPLTFTRNICRRTNAYDLTTFNQEQNVQGLLAQNNGGTIVWNPIDVRWNMIAGGQSAGITIFDASNGHISYNAVIWQEYNGASRSRFSLGNVDSSVTVTKNVGDETESTSNWYKDDGGNTFTDTGNLYVDGNDGSQDAAYHDWKTYPQTRAGLAPKSSGAIDTAGAGPMDVGGTLRG